MRTVLMFAAFAAPIVAPFVPIIARGQIPIVPSQIPAPRPVEVKDPTVIEPGQLADTIEARIRTAVAQERLRIQIETQAKIAAAEAQHRAELAAIREHIEDITREEQRGLYKALDSYIHSLGMSPFTQPRSYVRLLNDVSFLKK